jgi:hypothetical protein
MIVGVIEMFNKFPREFANPKRRLVFSKEEFYSLINKFLPYTNLYTSVYSFKQIDSEKNQPIYDSAEIDKIFVDVDEPSEWEAIKHYHNLLTEQNILHTLVFSGKGFHIYVFCKLSDEDVQGWVKKEAIRNFITSTFKKLKYDEVVVGDLARITRIPNTFNFRRKRWCIPLSSKFLELSYDEICKKAEKQNLEWDFFGKKKIVLKVEEIKNEVKKFNEVDIEDVKKILITEPIFPPFLKKIIDKKKYFWDRSGGWKERYLIILWLKEIGFTFKECVAYLKSILTKPEFVHCVFEEKQPQYLYSKEFTKNPYHFPKIEKLKEYGFKIEKEDEEFFKTHKIYLEEEDLNDGIV